MIEPLELARLQVISAWENQALVAGQHHARLFDLVQSHRLLDLAVVNQVSCFFFLIRFHLQQNQIADDRIMDLGIVQRLIRMVDRFGVNTFAGIRVVFDLHGQIAANRFDKHDVIDRNVRVRTVAMLIASRSCPAKLVLSRFFDFVIAAIVDVFDFSRCHAPFKRLDVVGGLSDLENHVQHWSAAIEPTERRAFIKAIQFVKVAAEFVVTDQFKRVGVELVVGESISRKHISDVDVGFQAELNVVPEQKSVANGNQVARDAIVLSRNAFGGKQFGFDIAENIGASQV